MRVTNVTASDSEVSTEIELDLDRVPRSKRSQVKRDVGEFLVEKTQEYLTDAKSPVSKERFPALSPSYRSQKREEGLPAIANLEFEGDLRDSLRVKNTRSGLKLGHFKSSEAGKADGHNNFTGQSTLPQRRYLPSTGQAYKREIQSGVEDIVSQAIVEEADLPARELRSVSTRSDFWSVMESVFTGLNRTEIRRAVKRNPTLTDRLLQYNLLRFLG